VRSSVPLDRDPGSLDAIPGALKVAIELFDKTEAVETFGHVRLRKRSFSVERLDLETNEFVDLMLDGLDHGCHLPTVF
jgi:hypothetical protein